MIVRLLALSCFSFLAATVASAETPRQPTGKWVVDFADARCLASRSYGSEAAPLHLILKAPPLGEVLQINIVKKGSAETRLIDGEVVIDDGVPIETSLLEFGSKEFGQTALYVNLPWSEVGPMFQASAVRVQGRVRTDRKPRIRVPGTRVAVDKGRTDEWLALSHMDALLNVIQECVADLRRVWNIADDGNPGSNLQQPATGSLAGLFKSVDYPAIAITNDGQGTVTLALLVDETGRVADCSVIKTSGVAALDAQSCAIIKDRGKMKPAVDLDGKPAKSGVLQRIRWILKG